MKPPSAIQVAAIRYSLREARDPEENAALEDDWGRTDHKIQRILFKPGQGPDVLADTVFHELLHCCIFNSGCVAIIPSKDEEEKLVRALTPVLLDAMRRNPRLTDFLVT